MASKSRELLSNAIKFQLYIQWPLFPMLYILELERMEGRVINPLPIISLHSGHPWEHLENKNVEI